MKLYSGPLSLFTSKTRVALDEKGLAYERIEVGWSPEARYLPHHPDVVALNPKRQVPILVDGDVVVYDSTRIAEYLEDAYPDPPLFPLEPAQRARCRQLEAAADEILFPRVWDLIEERFYPPQAGGGPRSEERALAAERDIALYADGLEKELAGRAFLCDAFGVADIANFAMLNAAASLGAPVASERPRLGGWMERCELRPAVRRELEGVRAFLQQLLARGGARAAS